MEAETTLILGPLLDLWNFVRRPLPRIEMTVVEPSPGRLTSAERALSLSRDGHAALGLTTANLPEDAELRVAGLPQGVEFRSSRQGDQITVMLEALSDAELGSFDISAEARVGDRWAPTGVITLTVKPAHRLRAGQ